MSTTRIYTLSLHDALPILFESHGAERRNGGLRCRCRRRTLRATTERSRGDQARGRSPSGSQSALSVRYASSRSEEHTSELQSQSNIVCRLLLEKTNNKKKN